MKKETFVKYSLSIIFYISSLIIIFYLGYYNGMKDEQKQFSNNIVIEKFICPIEEKNIISISSNQGIRDMISDDTFKTSGNFHNGVDIACKEKTPVLAAKSGIVISVFPSFYNGKKWHGHNTYGGLIVILHNDSTISLYGHLSRTDVKEGDLVKQGQIIALSGGIKGKRGSGSSTGPHLHFSIYMDIGKLTEDLDSPLSF